MVLLRMRIAGRSMMPLLRDGQRVLVRPSAGMDGLRRGDVVAVRRGESGAPLLHRVLRVEEARFHTLGDGNVNPEGPWTGGDVLGRLAAVQDAAGAWRQPRRWVDALATATLGLPIGLRRRINRLAAPFYPGTPLAPAPASTEETPIMASESPISPPLPEWIDAQELGRELFIHDRRSGDVIILNGTARAIWTLSRRGCTADQILRLLAERFPDEDPARLEADTQGVLARMHELLGAAG